MNDVFKLASQNTTTTRTSLFKLSQSLGKTNHEQKCLSYVAPSIWNKLPDFLNCLIFLYIFSFFIVDLFEKAV